MSPCASATRAASLLVLASAALVLSTSAGARADATAPAAAAPAAIKKDATPSAQTPTPAPAPAAQATAAPSAPTTRALPSPFDMPPFPVADWTLNNGYPIGESWDVPPGGLQRAIFGHKLDKSRISVTGWLDAGMEVSTSRSSNLPTTYNLLPNHPVVDQLVLEVQRMPDTVQKDHIDWGFMSAHLVGIDYRFTSAKGYLDDQLLTHNNLYGYDPVLQYALVYFPKLADGSVLMVGRYISPIDIEAQLSLQNFLYSHSLMFGVDPYTYTGANMQIRLSKYFQLLIGVHGGNENVWWSGAPTLNGEFLLGWNSADNKDQIWGGFDSLGSGQNPGVHSDGTVSNPAHEHDNEQLFNAVWGHKFNRDWLMESQAYYMWMTNANLGGTASNGPTYPFASGGGPGPVLRGKSIATGFVNYTEHRMSKTEYLSFRTGYLDDPRGWRTGVPNEYLDLTFGYARWITPNIIIRPEINYGRAFKAPAWDNGTKSDQLMVGGDVILKF